MSSRRIVASCTGMLVVLVLAGWYGVAAFPLRAALVPGPAQAQAPPRDPRPGDARPETAREVELQKAIASAPVDPAAFIELAKLQEMRGAVLEAETTLLALRQAQPGNVNVYRELAALYRRGGQFDKAVGALEDMAALDPLNPNGHQVVATYYWEKAYKDETLEPAEKVTYIRQGLTAADRALAAKPDFVEALIYKNLLLRLQAGVETDTAKQHALLSEADTLRNRAMQLGSGNSQVMTFVPRAAAPPPPPLPPPPPGGTGAAGRPDRTQPVRVGSGILTPTKIRDERPVYPADAKAAGVQGVVIIEAVIDESGAVGSARVLRSIPLLDQAALDAVKQWQFTPTLLNGEAVPVIMTVTVNFTLQ